MSDFAEFDAIRFSFMQLKILGCFQDKKQKLILMVSQLMKKL